MLRLLLFTHETISSRFENLREVHRINFTINFGKESSESIEARSSIILLPEACNEKAKIRKYTTNET